MVQVAFSHRVIFHVSTGFIRHNTYSNIQFQNHVSTVHCQSSAKDLPGVISNSVSCFSLCPSHAAAGHRPSPVGLSFTQCKIFLFFSTINASVIIMDESVAWSAMWCIQNTAMSSVYILHHSLPPLRSTQVPPLN